MASSPSAPVITPAVRKGHAADWHHLDVDEAAARLDVSLSSGLSQREAARRLAEHGPNELRAARRVAAWKLLLEQFRNVLILILHVAVGLSVALGHATEALVIAAVVLLAAVLGFVQEYRAERAIEALGRMAAPTATVLRNGGELDIPARELVPGDLALLRAGDRASADGRLIDAVNLQVEESPLTGESLPVEKQTEALPDGELPAGDRTNMVYAGTTVAYGRGRALVVATGMQTEFGGIARMIETIERARRRPFSSASTGWPRSWRAQRSWSCSSSSRWGSSAVSRSWRCCCSGWRWRSRSFPRRFPPSSRSR
jgi:P-type Ca2+ transporter type 2C